MSAGEDSLVAPLLSTNKETCAVFAPLAAVQAAATWGKYVEQGWYWFLQAVRLGAFCMVCYGTWLMLQGLFDL
jgi:hypothetical protein